MDDRLGQGIPTGCLENLRFLVEKICHRPGQDNTAEESSSMPKSTVLQSQTEGWQHKNIILEGKIPKSIRSYETQTEL